MGPSEKFVSANWGLISKKKMGVKFFLKKYYTRVLYLVLIDYDISTAINIALKLACLGKLMAIIEAITKAKKNRF